ncbi:hypothetical protein CAEBREN_22145 [Caenorhabditis brenneri]|uniref:Uncharacterized protein n=1 Tax=Caenorhabditis brenneri TaxID=135651 RepID=G0NV34_CAEBE|nr:hypothetical protein CAEBREN_22145 [Caenorhabditis brenneri]
MHNTSEMISSVSDPSPVVDRQNSGNSNDGSNKNTNKPIEDFVNKYGGLLTSDDVNENVIEKMDDSEIETHRCFGHDESFDLTPHSMRNQENTDSDILEDLNESSYRAFNDNDVLEEDHRPQEIFNFDIGRTEDTESVAYAFPFSVNLDESDEELLDDVLEVSAE